MYIHIFYYMQNEHFNDHQLMCDSAIQIVHFGVVYFKLVQCMSIVERVAIN